MFDPATAVVDPTIPGISIRDVARRAIDAVHPDMIAGGPGGRHRAFLLRRSLARLDAELLRDLGLERDMV